MKLAMRVQAVSKKVTLITTAFVLAVSTLTASLPFILSQDANALSGFVYNSIPSSQALSYPSLGYAATSTSEWGDKVQLSGSNRLLKNVTINLTSWACESGGWNTNDCVSSNNATFSHPVTVNIYKAGASNTVGALLATKTQTIEAKYRPSTDTTHCTDGKWYDTATGTCNNGLAFDTGFDFSGQNKILPNNVIVTVAFATSARGLTSSGPYDSLNVSAFSSASTGAVADSDVSYWNTSVASLYTDHGAGGTSTLRADTGWTGSHLGMTIVADQTPVTTEVVTGNTSNAENSLGWMFNRDTTTPYSFYGGNASMGAGAIAVAPISNTTASNKFTAEHFIQKPIDQISHISVDYKLGASTNADQVYFNVYANYGTSELTKFYDCRYDVVANSGSTSAYSTLTFDPNSSYAVKTSAGSPTCPNVPSDMNTTYPGSTIRAYSFNFGDTTLSDAGMSAYFDKATLATTSGTTVYDFEPAPVNTSSTTFVNDPKYVRESNGSDLVAQIVTPTTTEDVRFIVDGNTNAKIAGQNAGGAGATTDWWRLRTPLVAGEHTVTVEVKVSGLWRPVSDSAKAYSLDTPTASYVLPSNTNAAFRSSDNPLRLKIDDQFEQFAHVTFKVNGVAYDVVRANCDLRQAGNYVLCDVNKATDSKGVASWTALSDGNYSSVATVYTKANNRLDNLVSPSFLVDNSKPTIANFTVSPLNNNGTFTASATATDSQSDVESVSFYVTAPRVDGACTGNGTMLYQQRVTASTGGVYTAQFDINDLNGDYCVNAIARNNAFGNSDIAHQSIFIDTTAPTATINTIAPARVGDIVIAKGNFGGDYASYSVLLNGDDRTADVTVSPAGDWEFVFDTTLLATGTYNVEVNAVDAVGNSANKASNISKSFTLSPALPRVDTTPGTANQGTGDGSANNNPTLPSAVGAQNILGDATTNNNVSNTDGNTLNPSGAEDVKGTSTEKNFAEAATTNTDGKAFGLAWYWWLLIVAGAMTIVWWIVSAVRSARAQA